MSFTGIWMKFTASAIVDGGFSMTGEGARMIEKRLFSHREGLVSH